MYILVFTHPGHGPDPSAHPGVTVEGITGITDVPRNFTGEPILHSSSGKGPPKRKISVCGWITLKRSLRVCILALISIISSPSRGTPHLLTAKS